MYLKNFKYATKIQLLFIPVFVLMGIGLVIVYQTAAHSLSSEHTERLRRTAQLTGNGLIAKERELVRLVNLFQANKPLKKYLYVSTELGGNRAALRALMNHFYASLAIDDLDLFDDAGTKILDLEVTQQNYSRRETVAGLVGSTPKGAVSGFTETSGTIKITAVSPLTNADRVIGYIAIGKNIDRDYLVDMKNISGNDILLVKGGVIFASTLGYPAASLPYAPEGGKAALAGATYLVHERAISGMDGGTLGKMVVALSDETLQEAVSKLKLLMLGLLGLAAALSCSMSRLLVRALVKPLEKITLFTGKVAEGNLDDELTMTGKDEIAALAGHFNNMRRQLKADRDIVNQYTGNLERSVKERTAELEEVQRQLFHSQKLDAVGQMAGGIAHDFNNVLTVIAGHAGYLQKKVQADEKLRMHADRIISAAKKAGNLTHGLLAFSRKQVIKPMPIDLNEIVRDMEKLIVRLIGEDIDLETKPAETALTVMADRSQMEQALINLATNARDAMPYGGRLTIATSVADIDGHFIQRHACGKPGLYAALSVRDTGAGMDRATKEKIFEPFFTTKEVGKGAGLGLAMVYGIVTQHDGCIVVNSEVGEGAAFTIYLPLIEREAGWREYAQADSPPHGGTETILVAEDDQDIRDLSRSVLEEAGYTVIEAANGEDAMVQFSRRKDDIQLLLLDVVMPKKNGIEVFMEIRDARPDVRVLFVSGYAADIIQTKGILKDEHDLLMKPVSPNMLLRKVREVLDRK